MSDIEPLITTSEVAKILRISETQVRKYIRAGFIPAVRIQRGKREEFAIEPRVLKEFFEAGGVPPKTREEVEEERRARENGKNTTA